MMKAGKLTLNVFKTRNLLNKRRNYQPMLSSIVVSDNSEFFPEKSREICRTLSLESLYSRRNFLASGSFGEVHRVIRRSDGKCMAMKVVDLKEAHHNEHDMPVIIRRHKPSTDSVITVDQVFVERNQMFIVFDLMKGMDMLDYLLEIGPVSEELSSRLMTRILNCVKDCHDSGVAHLDVKPDNLMFRHEAKDGKIENINPEDLVLVDFGSSRLLGHEEEHLGIVQATGTVGYVAPEILADRGSLASDMWSVGVVAYMTMTGKMPFPMGRKGAESTLKGSFKQEEQWESLSPEAKDFVSNLLLVNPSDRMSVDQALNHEFI